MGAHWGLWGHRYVMGLPGMGLRGPALRLEAVRGVCKVQRVAGPPEGVTHSPGSPCPVQLAQCGQALAARRGWGARHLQVGTAQLG